MTTLTATPQAQFNWGYHDGASDVEHSRSNKWATKPHFSNEYRQGYLAGFADATRGEYTEDSTDAWYYAKMWGDV